MTPQPSEQPDQPEGTLTRRVLVSETLFRQLGLFVEWGEPDEDGFYTPTLRLATAPDFLISGPQAEAAAPDPVADPTMLCGKCQHPMHWRECGADADLTAPCQCRNDVAIADPVATRAHAVFGQPGDDQRVVDEVIEARKAAVLLEGLRPFLLHRVTVAIVDGLAEYARLEGQPVAEERT